MGKNRKRLGERLIGEFTEFRDALRSRQPIERKYTVKTVELDLRPKEYDAESIRVLRLHLGVSQAIFARILGISADLVAAWEQGHRMPTQMACRLLELVERDKRKWIQMLRGASKERTAQTA